MRKTESTAARLASNLNKTWISLWMHEWNAAALITAASFVGLPWSRVAVQNAADDHEVPSAPSPFQLLVLRQLVVLLPIPRRLWSRVLLVLLVLWVLELFHLNVSFSLFFFVSLYFNNFFLIIYSVVSVNIVVSAFLCLRVISLFALEQVISRCTVYSISTMQTLPWDGIEFGNIILIATIHLWDQSIENSMSSSPLGCDFVTSLLSSCGTTHDWVWL